MAEFEEVYRRYFRDVYLYAKALTRDPRLAEEIVSETFFKAMRGLADFRGGCDVRVWLCRIARNCYYSHLRKAGRLTELEGERADPDAGPEEAFLRQDTAMRAHAALHRLPEPYREVFSLRIFGELNFAQIGAVFDRTANWACVTFHRARKALIRGLEEETDGTD